MKRMLHWLIDRSIAQKIISCFGVLILGGICVGLSTFSSLSQIETAQGWAVHSYQVLEVSKEIRIIILRQEDNVRGYILSRDPDFLERAHGEDITLRRSLLTIKHLTSDNSLQQIRLPPFPN